MKRRSRKEFELPVGALLRNPIGSTDLRNRYYLVDSLSGGDYLCTVVRPRDERLLVGHRLQRGLPRQLQRFVLLRQEFLDGMERVA